MPVPCFTRPNLAVGSARHGDPLRLDRGPPQLRLRGRRAGGDARPRRPRRGRRREEEKEEEGPEPGKHDHRPAGDDVAASRSTGPPPARRRRTPPAAATRSPRASARPRPACGPSARPRTRPGTRTGSPGASSYATPSATGQMTTFAQCERNTAGRIAIRSSSTLTLAPRRRAEHDLQLPALDPRDLGRLRGGEPRRLHLRDREPQDRGPPEPPDRPGPVDHLRLQQPAVARVVDPDGLRGLRGQRKGQRGHRGRLAPGARS